MTVIDQEFKTGPDPLGVLASCAAVVAEMAFVDIDRDAIARLAGALVSNRTAPPAWDDGIHFQGEGVNAVEQTIGWIFALDALNFCFWAQGPDPAYRWRIESNGATLDGYMALAVALRDAARAGTPVWDPAWQATVDEAVPGSAPIPLLDARVANLREMGQAILDLDAADQPYTAFVNRSRGSAPALVREVVETCPSFDDAAPWAPRGAPQGEITVRFYKRAQILVSDLAGALGGSYGAANPGVPLLTGLDQLTAFADYKVPQVLRHLGILRYSPDLASRIHARDLLAPGSREEVEIRAATIWACEMLRQELSERGGTFTAADVDWLLWNAGQDLPASCEPYHRTVTISY
jgi:hypothetical protein